MLAMLQMAFCQIIGGIISYALKLRQLLTSATVCGATAQKNRYPIWLRKLFGIWPELYAGATCWDMDLAGQ